MSANAITALHLGNFNQCFGAYLELIGGTSIDARGAAQYDYPLRLPLLSKALNRSTPSEYRCPEYPITL